MADDKQVKWPVFKGNQETPHPFPANFPYPDWRKPKYDGEPIVLDLENDPDYKKQTEAQNRRGKFYEAGDKEIALVNAALFLHRPLLVKGKPGSGKSSLAYAIAYELGLGPVLVWSINTRATLQEGLYRYDAVARLQDASFARDSGDKPDPDMGKYFRLGPLGTAMLPYSKPRVLLIDEIDKSDIDLPNDLLNIFEEGEFEIPELVRVADRTDAVNIWPYDSSSRRERIYQGKVVASHFPIVVMTSNDEREFPPAFLRRCLRLEMPPLDNAKLSRIVEKQFGFDQKKLEKYTELIETFVKRQSGDEQLATDQLMNAIYLMNQSGVDKALANGLNEDILRNLSER